MDSNQGIQNRSLFPLVRPSITVSESDTVLDPIECLELQWWFAIPRGNDHTAAAFYDVETLALDRLRDIVPAGPAQVHGIDCMEMQVSQSLAETGWEQTTSYHYCKIGTNRTEWLAVTRDEGNRYDRYTFRDQGFAQDWGATGEHRLVDNGRYQLQADGSYRVTNGKGLGVGVYDVTIGDNTFLCMRVLDPGSAPNEHQELCEAYVDTSGRTVLYRQYRGRLMRYNKEQDRLERCPDERYPHNLRVVIDGCLYVQCNCTGRAHDVITNTGLGISPGNPGRN